MRVRFGGYYHRVAEVDVQITRTPVFNAVQVPVAYREQWTLQGKLFNPSPYSRSMYGILSDFEFAYSSGGKDLVLEHDNGVASYHTLRNSDCLGGTRVVEPPSFPSGRFGEYASYRTYRVVVEGVRVYGNANQWLNFRETIKIRGGGEKYGCIEVNEGVGVRQRLRSHSTCYATQSGSGSGYLYTPDPPPPIWPFALVDQYPEVDIVSPETIGSFGDGVQVNHEISWSYSYEYPQRLAGTPHYLT